MIFNQIKYKSQNNNIEITENILWSMAGDSSNSSFIKFIFILISEIVIVSN